MSSHAMTRIALVGGSLIIALATGLGVGEVLSDTPASTSIADPGPVEDPAPPLLDPPAAAPPSQVVKVRPKTTRRIAPELLD